MPGMKSAAAAAGGIMPPQRADRPQSSRGGGKVVCEEIIQVKANSAYFHSPMLTDTLDGKQNGYKQDC